MKVGQRRPVIGVLLSKLTCYNINLICCLCSIKMATGRGSFCFKFDLICLRSSKGYKDHTRLTRCPGFPVECTCCMIIFHQPMDLAAHLNAPGVMKRSAMQKFDPSDVSDEPVIISSSSSSQAPSPANDSSSKEIQSSTLPVAMSVAVSEKAPSSSVSVALSVSTTPSTSVTSSPTFPSSVPAFRLHSPADFLLLYHLLSLCQSCVASVAQITRAREMEASFRSQLRGDIAFFPDADDGPKSSQ